MAFTLSAALGLVTVVIALFVRRNPEEAGHEPAPGPEVQGADAAE